MKTLALTLVLTLFVVSSADAGIFGRGRGIFRGRWGSRNVPVDTSAACGTCSPAVRRSACGPNGCAPAILASPKKASQPAISQPLSP